MKLINRKKKHTIFRLFFGMLLSLHGVAGLASEPDASHDLYIEAYIPDLIELSGLPNRINLEWQDGRLTHRPVHFDVNRSYASRENPQPYRIQIESSEGESGDQFYLSHEQHADEKIFLNIQFKDQEEADFIRYFRASQALTGTTIKNIGSQLSGESSTASIILFNHDQNYLFQRMPGEYSAIFTVKVMAI